MGSIESRIRKAVMPFLADNDCRLWDVVFEKEGAYHYLRVLFDCSDGALDMDTCERLTRPLNELIDAEKIEQIDIVEVGSPGITRRLRHAEHFEQCTGKRVRVLKRADNGKTETLLGVLQGFNEQDKSVKINEESILLKKCLRVTLEEREEQMQ
ncbi:MAG: ribosome maturation factor RimP [Oscillospiraceae bacterium]|nr:ribosome maturation factor RimP [Oscillospiraceae bacterium]